MYFSWVFILLSFIYAVGFVFLPTTGEIALGCLFTLGLWLLDCAITLRTPKIKIERHYPNPIYQNENSSVELAITNPTRYRIRIYLKDEPPFEAKISKILGWLTIPAKQTIVFSYDLVITKRGVFYFGKVNVKVTGWLRMFCKIEQLGSPEAVNVYPSISVIGDYHFSKTTSSETEGPHRVKLFGVDGELAQLREFVTGDDYRKINWKVTAHLGKPYLNEFEPEKDQNVFLLFDTGRLLYDQADKTNSRFDQILDAAILLVYNVLHSGDMVGAISFGHKVDRFLPVGKGNHQLQLFIKYFFNLEAEMVESDYRNAFQYWEQRNNKRSLLFVYTDLIDQEASRELINNLLITSRHHLVVCVLPRKQQLERLVADPITDEKIAYQKGVAIEFLNQREQLKRKLTNQGIGILEVDAINIRQAVVEHYYYLKHIGRF